MSSMTSLICNRLPVSIVVLATVPKERVNSWKVVFDALVTAVMLPVANGVVQLASVVLVHSLRKALSWMFLLDTFIFAQILSWTLPATTRFELWAAVRHVWNFWRSVVVSASTAPIWLMKR